MNKTLKSRLMSIALASSIAAAIFCAPAAQASNQTVGPVQITQIKAVPGTSGTNNIYLGLASAWPNADSCSNSTYAIIENSMTNYNILMTMVYDAYANGDTVTFNLNGCVTVGATSYPIITYFILQKS